MIDDRTEETAALYALGLLSAEERARFDGELQVNAELRALVDELEASAASLAQLVPPKKPPSHLRAKILATVRGDTVPLRTVSHRSWIPWTLAAGLAICAGMLTKERVRLREEIAGLRSQDALSQLRIAALSSKVEGAPNSIGAVVWDSDKQRGVLAIEKLPPPGPAQDYQLWVIDPNYKQPVSGGIVRVDENGSARLIFTVDVPIRAADQFAISRERKGGVSAVQGPIVLMGK